MQINNIKRNTKRKEKTRVGRGGVKGKTSGRGTKGQKARAGNKRRPEIRDIIRKIPRRRGRGKNLNTSVTDKFVIVSLSSIEKSFEKGEVVSPKTLVEKNVISKRGGKFPSVKVLSNGTISKALKFEKCKISSSAKEAIEKVGGEIVA